LVKGEPLGKYIDEMDEVVRFNNFQTKASAAVRLLMLGPCVVLQSTSTLK